MSNSVTLNARLRVLIAKAYRAERLYKSINGKKLSWFGNSEALAQIADDVRATQWQNNHFNLRRSLNEILSKSTNSSQLAHEVAILRDHYRGLANESRAALRDGSAHVVASVKREEFAASFKTSLSMIVEKARFEVTAMIADELNSLLEATGRSGYVVKPRQQMIKLTEDAVVSVDLPESGNVVPLRRGVAR